MARYIRSLFLVVVFHSIFACISLQRNAASPHEGEFGSQDFRPTGKISDVAETCGTKSKKYMLSMSNVF